MGLLLMFRECGSETKLAKFDKMMTYVKELWKTLPQRRNDGVSFLWNFKEKYRYPQKIFREAKSLFVNVNNNLCPHQKWWIPKKNISIQSMKNTALVNRTWIPREPYAFRLRACDWGNEESRIVVTYLIKCLEGYIYKTSVFIISVPVFLCNVVHFSRALLSEKSSFLRIFI